MIENPDVLVIGGGVIGVNLAREAKRRHSAMRVTVLEKESALASHASGRNSGVLHAGFYYTADSLKARFTRDGNRELTAYCTERGLRIRRCGKLVVARDASELAGLDELSRRAERNGVELHRISESEARDIEPRVRTHESALYSPTTASVDPREVMASFEQEARQAGVDVQTGVAYRGFRNGQVITSRGYLSPGYVINAGGLYADRIARDFGFSQHYRIIPFKGLYLYEDAAAGGMRTNIYPVPDLNNPFLGVHYTVTVDGKTKIGPTAIPAFWREHYDGLKNFRASEFVEILAREAMLFTRNEFGFRRIAMDELRKYSRRRMASLAAHLADGVRVENYTKWGPPGIRAQLIDTRHNRLEMDFRFEGDDRSFHVLNAVSPAFTCALPFTRYLFDEVEKRWSKASHPVA